MTKIEIYLKANDIVGFECKNHSGYAESGKDIVCAGISSITQTAVLGLENIAKIGCEVKIDQKQGYLSVQIDQNEWTSTNFKTAQVILQTMLCGLEDLEKQYPKNLKLEEKVL